MINVTISTNDLRKLERSLTATAAVRAFTVAQKAAKIMEEEVVDIVDHYFVTDRPAKRRHPNTTRLINSFRGFVDGERGQFPVTAVLGLKRGVNEKKVAALEHGSPPHFIFGTPWLAFPRSVLEEGTLSNLIGRGRIRNAYGGGRRSGFATQTPVFHPGNVAYNFMKQARERARRKIRNR